MNKHLQDYISYLLNIRIRKILPVSGGDISKAYLLETDTERFFCKLNHSSSAKDMFLAEKGCLEAIDKTKTIKTPKVLLCEALEKGAFLIMEYVDPKRPDTKDFESLGNQLAELHKTEASEFGWEFDNFIGSLPQSNKKHSDWISFYVNERLYPQLKIAGEKGLLAPSEIPSHEKMETICSSLFQNIRPSLLHGDLWGGNYLVATDGTPYLIDPAVYFGHGEVDIAMTRLFGGFPEHFYSAYGEHFPKSGRQKKRQDLYQLYYLLVHLNLFGRSYYASVKTVLDKYFR